ncbi:MAG TPA: TonB-dependent receptor [Vicinamibacterales bacterium]|nr:TonB-dependent receptor [Vicinamibacterales bacterium]
MTRLWRGVLAATLSVMVTASADAQQRDTRMLITVIDQTNAVIPGATVAVIGAEPATQKGDVPPAKTTANGLATIGGLIPGRYTARAEFPGFYPGVLKEVRVRQGDNRHIIVLLIENFQDSVNVSQDAQAGAADRRSDAFGSVLTREQMDLLSDDPDEMQRQLMEMAGPGAVLRIDSFEGGRLPPKSQIKSIRVTRDQFAAENHSADSFFVEVITQPGIGPIRTGFNYGMRSSAMSARNAFTPTKGEEQEQNFGLNIGGGLIQNKASFFLRVFGNSAYDTPNSSIASSTGTRIETLKQRVPRKFMSANGNFDWAATRDQTLRFSFNRNVNINKNQGIGGYDEPERAFTSENHTNTFRAQEVGPLGRRFFFNTRLNVGWTDFERRSAFEARTVRIIDAQTFGGAQKAGGRHSRDVNFASDLDYVRGMHSIRVGTAIDGNWFRSNESDNYLGTYTFENLDTFAAGLPRSYTRRVGTPDVSYFNLQAAVYVQDDIRIRRNLSVTPGLRVETQNHINGVVAAPRIGATWAPFKDGKTTLRVSWGIFYDWLQTNTYEQTVRIDGFQQREINIANPSYPEPPSTTAGPAPPADRYLLDPALKHPKNSRVSGGIDYAFSPRLRVNAIYRYITAEGILRGLNLNAPVNGIRPLPDFANVIQVVGDGRMRQHLWTFGGHTNPPQEQGRTAPRWNFKRFNFFGNYTLAWHENNTDGPFSVPSTGDLATEWGQAASHARHRFFGGFLSQAFRGLSVQFNVNGNLGTTYGKLSPYDENGDLIFNDRPANEARNTLLTDPTWTLNMFTGYSFTFGPSIQLPPGIQFGPGAGGTLTVTTVTRPDQGRYRMSLNVFINNLTNRTNPMGYSGVLGSRFYAQPTSAQGARRIQVSTNLQF